MAFVDGLKKGEEDLANDEDFNALMDLIDVYMAVSYTHLDVYKRQLLNRYRNYNRVMELVEKWEEEGHIFVIRPEVEPVSRLSLIHI